jgi:hypothetical protein
MTRLDLLIRNICEDPDVPDPAADDTILVTDKDLRGHVASWLESEFGLTDGPCATFHQRVTNEELVAHQELVQALKAEILTLRRWLEVFFTFCFKKG